MRAPDALEAAPGLRRQKSPGTHGNGPDETPPEALLPALPAVSQSSDATPDAVGQCTRLAPDRVHFMATVRQQPPSHRRILAQYPATASRAWNDSGPCLRQGEVGAKNLGQAPRAKHLGPSTLGQAPRGQAPRGRLMGGAKD